MKIYNTLTRNKEEFEPINDKTVTMYSCGPTVYNYAHIGNLRTYIFMDLVRRVLKENKYKIKGVINITDVGHLLSDSDEGEDKMQIAAKREQKSPYEIAEYYTKIFFEDIAKINIGKPEITAKATGHIKEMLSFVEGLVDKGYGYETDDGIYFDISRFPAYGRLSGIDLEEQMAGARVEINSGKKSPYDFALWKKAEPEHIMQWESKWGMGYPGWHIECSAMSRKYLGDTFDIHTGGVDHVPIHHENEIAQSEALTGKKAVNYWMHGEFMLVDNGKMSKSLGNTYTVSDLENKGYRPLDFRYFCLNAHYRKRLNFTFEGLDAAHTALDRMYQQVAAHKGAEHRTDAATLDKYRADYLNAINDDVNIPMALGVLWTMLREEKSGDIYKLALEMDRVFGLDLDKAEINQNEPETEIPGEIKELLAQRKQARDNKDFALSDVLRDRIAAQGYSVKDTKDGQKVTKN